jgi:hypothetical protein
MATIEKEPALTMQRGCEGAVRGTLVGVSMEL